MRKFIRRFLTVFSVVIFSFGALVFFSYMWMLRTWSEVSLDELIFQLSMPLQGTGNGMIRNYLLQAALPTAILIICLILALLLLWKKGKNFHILQWISLAAGGFFLLFSILRAWNTLGVSAYLGMNSPENSVLADQTAAVSDSSSDSASNDFVANNYVNPADTDITFPEKKRNLIYIYLESMEMTFSNEKNGGAKKQNVIPELTELAETNEDFAGSDQNTLNGGIVYPGTTWTMGAMFAQTSGLPLQLSISANDMDTQSSFFPNITTLGDILAKEGYQQTLLIGSDATFGGRKLYFSEHGNYQIHDYNYAISAKRIPSDYYVWWGYEDEKLFSYAREELTEMASSEQPFNLTLLTVDTHFPDGYICDLCKDDFPEQYANVLACSSRQVTAFVKWIQQQDFYDNTTIVISGDHTTMDPNFCKDVDDSYLRKTYTAYVHPAVQPADPSRKRTFSTFDNFPTTLAALGVSIPGDRLGLGTNLFSDTDTLTEKYGYDAMNTALSKRSGFLSTIESVDENAEALVAKNGDMHVKADIKTTVSSENPDELVVTVSSIENPHDDALTKAELEVYSREDKKDIQILEMEPSSDGKSFSVSLSGKDYKEKQLHLSVDLTSEDDWRYTTEEKAVENPAYTKSDS